MLSQKGSVPLLVLIAGIGLIAFLGVVSIAPFRDGLLSSLFPKDSSQAAVDEWIQDGHDGQRTGVTPEEPSTPWTFAWAFNGPDAQGGAAGHIYDAPKEARIVTGGAHIYVPAGSKGIFALRKTDGSVAWNITNTSFNAAPVYDPATQTVIAGGADGQLYKINASTGAILGTFNTGSSINKALLLAGGYVYSVSDNGKLNKITISNVSPVWSYAANSAGQTPPAYSPSRDAIIFATADLNVHAVNNNNGTQKWKVKPTPNTGGSTGPRFTYTFDKGWPVIAEKHGVVFVRMQLPHDFMYDYPSSSNIYPNDLATTRNWLISNPNHQNLFALNLDDGSKKFIPAVGYGSTEDYSTSINDAFGVMGSMPIVRVYPDGTEVAYIHFRNGQSNPPDFRWDGHMGEMVLDDTTISGLKAGDLRFVKMSSFGGMGGNSYVHIVDEETPISMAGEMLFNAHWAASTGVKITDRTANRGLTFAAPILSSNLLPIVRAIKSCSNFNATTHYTTCGLSYVTDGGRYFGGPGYWGYWNVVDPPGWRVGSGNTAGSSYSAGFLPRYTYVSDGQMIVEGNGGELLVFKHSGTISQTSPTPSVAPSASPSASPAASSVVSAPISPSPAVSPSPLTTGDIDGNNKVDIFDYNILLTNFGKSGSGIQGDIDSSGKVDIFDYNILLTNFGK